MTYSAHHASDISTSSDDLLLLDKNIEKDFSVDALNSEYFTQLGSQSFCLASKLFSTLYWIKTNKNCSEDIFRPRVES